MVVAGRYIRAGRERISRRLIDNTHLVPIALQGLVVDPVGAEDLEELEPAAFAMAILARQQIAATLAEKRQVFGRRGILYRDVIIYVLLFKLGVDVINMLGK